MDTQYFLGQAIEVPMMQFWIGQGLGLIVLLFDFLSFQQNDQRKYFFYTAFSSLFWIGMFGFVGAQLPVLLVACVSTIRNFIFWWALKADTPKARMIARRTVYCSLVLALIAAAITIPGVREGTVWVQIVLLITLLAFVCCQYMPGIWLVRISGIFYAGALIISNSGLDTFSLVGILIEANKIISILVFFAIYYKKKKKREVLAAIRPSALLLANEYAKAA